MVKVKALNPKNFKKTSTSTKHASNCVKCDSRTNKKINQRRRIDGWMLDFFKAKKVISLSFSWLFLIIAQFLNKNRSTLMIIIGFVLNEELYEKSCGPTLQGQATLMLKLLHKRLYDFFLFSYKSILHSK